MSLSYYFINIVNIKILSLNVFSKTTWGPFKENTFIQQLCTSFVDAYVKKLANKKDVFT